MIGVRVSKDQRAAIVGAPSYFKSHPKPKTPHDLLSHKCINFRHGSAGIYRWEFDKGKKSLSVAVNGPLIVDDVEIVIRAALDGIGLAFVGEDKVAQHLASGIPTSPPNLWTFQRRPQIKQPVPGSPFQRD